MLLLSSRRVVRTQTGRGLVMMESVDFDSHRKVSSDFISFSTVAGTLGRGMKMEMSFSFIYGLHAFLELPLSSACPGVHPIGSACS